jgi:hypothetical protein
MSEQSITLKTVTAPPFKDCNSMLTPRLQLVVRYTKGGTSIMTGAEFVRGYEVSIQHDRLSNDGFRQFLIDGRGNPTATLEQASRFSAKTLDRLVGEIRSGKHNATIAHLYALAKTRRPEHNWPEAILPLEPEKKPCTALIVV